MKQHVTNLKPAATCQTISTYEPISSVGAEGKSSERRIKGYCHSLHESVANGLANRI
jgi:hypothetical protein